MVTKVHGTSFGAESLTKNMNFFTVRTLVDISVDANRDPSDVSQSSLDRFVETVSLRAQPVILGNASVSSEATPSDLPGYAQAGAVALASVYGGSIQSVDVLQAGIGMTAVPTVGFAGGGGSGATATAKVKAVSVAVAVGGADYAVGDTITLAGGTFSSAVVLLVTGVTSGAVSSVEIVDGGSYSAIPANAVAEGSTSGSGDGNATFNIRWGLGSVTVTNAGAGYTSAPLVTLTGATMSGNLPVYTIKFAVEHDAAWSAAALADALNGVNGFIYTSPTTYNNVSVTLNQTL